MTRSLPGTDTGFGTARGEKGAAGAAQLGASSNVTHRTTASRPAKAVVRRCVRNNR
ncbi:hypothetical protein ABZ719_01545 [Streptomyces sp. NPDC006743]|uniref:hypothetical protein n=1 Tax=Streptomyces sp. NPDC006743 TaxID=3154480 RepID=UPI003453B34C